MAAAAATLKSRGAPVTCQPSAPLEGRAGTAKTLETRLMQVVTGRTAAAQVTVGAVLYRTWVWIVRHPDVVYCTCSALLTDAASPCPCGVTPIPPLQAQRMLRLSEQRVSVHEPHAAPDLPTFSLAPGIRVVCLTRAWCRWMRVSSKCSSVGCSLMIQRSQATGSVKTSNLTSTLLPRADTTTGRQQAIAITIVRICHRQRMVYPRCWGGLVC